ncbi:hypothetical protein, partial [Staphylococcus pseudintermedius]|uniref:hypothetical protein n=1 Tax=Staphylococcus pseudintermedius TaxID=283734 RepID=UPI00115B18C4
MSREDLRLQRQPATFQVDPLTVDVSALRYNRDMTAENVEATHLCEIPSIDDGIFVLCTGEGRVDEDAPFLEVKT